MNYEEELAYREQLVDKSCKGSIITAEERYWLSTH